MRNRRFVVQVSFTYQEHLLLSPLLKDLQVHTGMNKSQLIKRMIAFHGSRVAQGNCINRSDADDGMQKRIETNRRVMELLHKLERRQVFVTQFGTTQEFIEWSLSEALKALDKRPLKPLKRIESQVKLFNLFIPIAEKSRSGFIELPAFTQNFAIEFQ